MAPKFTLVPSELFSESSAREILSEVVPLEEGEPLSFAEIPSRDAVLVYTGASRPVVYDMILSLCKIGLYNKIIACISDGWLYITVARGEVLDFCNCFKVVDFVTAEYYMLMVLKKLQINPEISTIYFMSPLSEEQTVALLSYFKNAEVLQ